MAKSDASPNRRQPEPARTQPGRELAERRGPHLGGVADELNEPVWLWPEHTMRTSAKEWPDAELGRPAQTSAMVRSAVSNHHRSNQDRPGGAVQSPGWLATTQPPGPSRLPLRAALTGRP